MRSKSVTALAVLAMIAPLAACGDDGPSAGSRAQGCSAVVRGEVVIVARDVAWDTDCLEAPPGQPFTVVVDNQDREVNHDFHLSTGEEVLKTPLEAGPVVQRLEVPALEEGRYGYVCEIHPNMSGVLEVRPPG